MVVAREGITVQVSVEKLLDTLRTNREAHGSQYEKAKAGYLKVTKQQLNDYLDQLADGQLLVQRYIEAPPDDHTSDYDDAIEMMEWSQESTIELTQGQFKQYVLDNWGWKDSWMASNTTYLQA